MAEVEISLHANYIASDAFDAIVLQLEGAALVIRRVAQSRFSTLQVFVFMQLDAVNADCLGSSGEQQCAKEFSQYIN